MKTTISVTLPPGAELTVNLGDSVKKGDILARSKESSENLEIDMAGILGVKPQNISKYLKKRIGDHLEKDEILAFKKNFLSSTSVKSPARGVVEAIDLKLGNVSFKSIKAIERKVVSPIDGKIKSGNGQNVEIELDGEEFVGVKGKGVRVWGDLHLIRGETVGVLDIFKIVEDSVILVKNPTEAALAKLDVLGARGIVSLIISEDTALPTLSVSEHIFSKLEEKNGQSVILEPEKNRLLVLS